MNSKTSLAKILSVVRRYRIALLDLVLAELPPNKPSLFSDLQANTALQLFDAISGDRCVCFRRRTLPSSMAIARAVSIQWFCRANDMKRTLLTSADVEHYFPKLFRHGLPSGYYVDSSSEQPILGFARVDTHLASVGQIRQHARELIEKYDSDSAFQQLVVRRQFELTWLVPTETKSAAINAALVTLRANGIRCRAECVPKLLELLVPLQKTLPDVVGL